MSFVTHECTQSSQPTCCHHINSPAVDVSNAETAHRLSAYAILYNLTAFKVRHSDEALSTLVLDVQAVLSSLQGFQNL